MHIPRISLEKIQKYLKPNKVVIIYGPRRVGKTTLIKDILKKNNEDYLFISGEDRLTQEWLSSQSIDTLKSNIGNSKLLIIDKAQKIDQIGLNLKLIVDHIEQIKVIATGSSSFELANQIGEPLVGRSFKLNLFPISQIELNKIETPQKTKEKLDDRLIYGSYPEITTETDIDIKRKLLNSMVDNYLFRDLLELENLKRSQKLIDLLRLIAFQIGQEVSLNELANTLNLNQRTVERYLDLLEKVFVIQKLPGFARNLRKEISKSSKYYFYDLGIRNAVINNFNPLNIRNDIGQLWENYLFIERIKKQEYQNIFTNNYFWRTYDQKEIDLIEEKEGKLFAFEFKWNNKRHKTPKEFLSTYKNSEFTIINKSNYLNFIS